jgi:hypothetical protein
MPLRPRHAYAADIQRGLRGGDLFPPQSSPPNCCGCASQPSPDPPGSSWRED